MADAADLDQIGGDRRYQSDADESPPRRRRAMDRDLRVGLERRRGERDRRWRRHDRGRRSWNGIDGQHGEQVGGLVADEVAGEEDDRIEARRRVARHEHRPLPPAAAGRAVGERRGRALGDDPEAGTPRASRGARD